MTKTYGIPRVIESSELFTFNKDKKIRVMFTGGITDPKYNIPATFVTDDEFLQIVIESSPAFGKRIFRYLENGKIVKERTAGTEVVTPVKKNVTKAAKVAEEYAIPQNKTFEGVKTLGDATEVLLQLGASADELNGEDAILSCAIKNKVAFPNLSLK